MHAWGPGLLQNEPASRLVDSFAAHDNSEQALAMLCRVMAHTADAPPEADLAQARVAEALAAAVIVIAWSGGPAVVDVRLVAWLAAAGALPRGPVQLSLARRVLDRAIVHGNGWLGAHRAAKTAPEAIRLVTVLRSTVRGGDPLAVRNGPERRRA